MSDAYQRGFIETLEKRGAITVDEAEQLLKEAAAGALIGKGLTSAKSLGPKIWPGIKSTGTRIAGMFKAAPQAAGAAGKAPALAGKIPAVPSGPANSVTSALASKAPAPTRIPLPTAGTQQYLPGMEPASTSFMDKAKAWANKPNVLEMRRSMARNALGWGAGGAAFGGAQRLFGPKEPQY